MAPDDASDNTRRRLITALASAYPATDQKIQTSEEKDDPDADEDP